MSNERNPLPDRGSRSRDERIRKTWQKRAGRLPQRRHDAAVAKSTTFFDANERGEHRNGDERKDDRSDDARVFAGEGSLKNSA
jgi:hypothetical protein